MKLEQNEALDPKAIASARRIVEICTEHAIAAGIAQEPKVDAIMTNSIAKNDFETSQTRMIAIYVLRTGFGVPPKRTRYLLGKCGQSMTSSAFSKIRGNGQYSCEKYRRCLAIAQESCIHTIHDPLCSDVAIPGEFFDRNSKKNIVPKKPTMANLDTLSQEEIFVTIEVGQVSAKEHAYAMLTERGMPTAMAIMRGFASPTKDERQAIEILDYLGPPDMTTRIVSSSSAGQMTDEAPGFGGFLSLTEVRAADKALGAIKVRWNGAQKKTAPAREGTRAA